MKFVLAFICVGLASSAFAGTDRIPASASVSADCLKRLEADPFFSKQLAGITEALKRKEITKSSAAILVHMQGLNVCPDLLPKDESLSFCDSEKAKIQAQRQNIKTDLEKGVLTAEGAHILLNMQDNASRGLEIACQKSK